MFPRRGLKHMLALLAVSAGFLVTLPAAAAAAADDFAAGFETLRAQDLRLAAVAHRLSIANKASCAASIEAQSGLVLHGIGQYDAEDRAAAARHFGFDAGVAVMAVVPGSAAHAAGISADDRLIAVNGHELDRHKAGSGRVEVDAAEALLREELGKGAATLRISRAGKLLDLPLQADQGCSLRAEVLVTKSVNAWANGERIMVAAKLLDRCRTENELALVVAHELAHNLLGHRKHLASLRVPESGFLRGLGAGSSRIRETEEEADRLGVRLALSASYDVGKAVAAWSSFLERGAPSGATHPSGSRRIALLQRAAAEAASRE
jgi:hypothetical protein